VVGSEEKEREEREGVRNEKGRGMKQREGKGRDEK
jgi:hypothetical protein